MLVRPPCARAWATRTLIAALLVLTLAPADAFAAEATAPAIPSITSVIGGDGSVEVRWATVTEDGGSPVTAYAVRRSTGEPGCEAPAEATSCTVTGLQNGQYLRFVLTALNAAGESAPSAPSNPVAPGGFVGQPQNVRAVAGPSSATVAWDAPQDLGNAGTPTYGVYSEPRTDYSSQCMTSATSCHVSGLLPGTSYRFFVYPNNSKGIGPISEPSAPVLITQSDTAAPVLTAFEVTPTRVDLADGPAQVTVTATITDSTGTGTPTVSLRSNQTTQTAGFGDMTLVSGTAANGTWTRTMTIPQDAAAGTWDVSLFPLRDSLGNSGDFGPPAGFAKTITVLRNGALPPADTEAPVLTAFDVTPTTVDLTQGPRAVTVTATVTDATEAQPPTVNLRSRDTSQSVGFGTMALSSGTLQSGTWTRTMTIPEDVATGIWDVSLFPLRDSLGNIGSFGPPPGFANSITVVRTGPPADMQPPVLAGFTVSPQQADLAAGPAEITVTARITDDTAAEAPVISLRSSETTQSAGFGTMTLISGTATDGTYSRTITVPQDAATGRWTVSLFPLRDAKGNTGDFGPPPGFPNGVDVTRGALTPPPDAAAPVLSSLVVNPMSVDVTSGPTQVQVTAAVTDATGVEAPVVSFTNGALTITGGPLALVAGTPQHGTWYRLVTVPQGAGTGTWTAVVNLRDTVGNTTTIAGAAHLTVTTAPPAPAPPADLAPPRLTTWVSRTVSLSNREVFGFQGSDSTSGVRDYAVRYRRAAFHTAFGAMTYPPSWQRIATTSLAVSAARGTTTCFSARARDWAGNISAWSAERCVAAPLDDRSLAASVGWSRPGNGRAYAGTLSTVARNSATLTRTGVQARRVYLLASRCRGCGTVDVYLNGTRLRRISLNAATSGYQQLIPVADLGRVRTGTITIRTVGTARVHLDGLVLGRV